MSFRTEDCMQRLRVAWMKRPLLGAPERTHDYSEVHWGHNLFRHMEASESIWRCLSLAGFTRKKVERGDRLLSPWGKSYRVLKVTRARDPRDLFFAEVREEAS